MAIKKSELYSTLLASSNALRGGMDASQYKDYILTLLFIKYVTDKYKGQKYGDLTVFDKAHDPETDPEKRVGCSFDDLVELKGKKNIGEGIDKIISRLADVNSSLKGVIDIAYFNDDTKIGKGQEMVDKLTKMIAIFQRPELDFSKNKAEGDDIIGDAYEYLMRNFAKESGKSKGQFYTPAEVSRILTKVIGIDKCQDHDAKVCDPACGSGSLLIRAVAEAPFEISGYGQEKDTSTAGLAKMNAVLHSKATICIKSGNTFSDPQFLNKEDQSKLDKFDYIVANPPFSLKNWMDGFKDFGRFDGYDAEPPEKNGDYAWLMHILKTLKSNGKAAVILPHGVLFRSNAEATIRKNILKKGYIKGIIGLPANLFYGTSIPACILVIDKQTAKERSGVFFIDASRDFVKDGDKNRLREQDIYKIVTTFNNQIITDPKYARFVPNSEIEGNEFNLNITRYIDSSEKADVHDIYAHMHGGIPEADINSMNIYWKNFPTLKKDLLSEFMPGYFELKIEENLINNAIHSNKEFLNYKENFDKAFNNWKNYADTRLKNINSSLSPKILIDDLATKLLEEYEKFTFVDKYDIYQVLLSYWTEVMNDDVLLIVTDKSGYGVAREVVDITKESKKKGEEKSQKVIGWDGKVIPKNILISELFNSEKMEIDEQSKLLDNLTSELAELVDNSDENSELSDLAREEKIKAKAIKAKIGELDKKKHSSLIDGIIKFKADFLEKGYKKNDYVEIITKNPQLKILYNDKGIVNKTSIENALIQAYKEAPIPDDYFEDYSELCKALELVTSSEEVSSKISRMEYELDNKAYNRYSNLSDDEIINLLVEKKWYCSISDGIKKIYTAVSNILVSRLTCLNSRYGMTLSKMYSQMNIIENELSTMLTDLEGNENDTLGMKELYELFKGK